MKRWKRVMVMGTLLTGTFTAGVFAQDVLQRVDAYLRPDFNIMLDGKSVQLDSPTLIYDGNSYLPIKQLGNLFGANIIWKDATKTIFINSRINSEQVVTDKDQTIEEFKFRSPYSIMVNYLGANYPLLLAYADGNSSSLLYYRLSDVRRMGIDTNGLKQSKEKLTGVLYVSELELKKLLKQMPTPNNSGRERYIISEELNTNKIKALQTYIKSENNNRMSDVQFTNMPIMIDKMDTENMYEYLYYQTRVAPKVTTNHYVSTKLILTKMEDGSDGYTVNTYGWTDLDDQLEREENLKADKAKKAEEAKQAAQK
jgi:hypothetical protein